MKGSLSPMKAWPVGHMSDYEGGISPAGSPSSSPKNRKKPSRTRTHPPHSTDDESEGETKKPSSKLNINTKELLQTTLQTTKLFFSTSLFQLFFLAIVVLKQQHFRILLRFCCSYVV